LQPNNVTVVTFSFADKGIKELVYKVCRGYAIEEHRFFHSVNSTHLVLLKRRKVRTDNINDVDSDSNGNNDCDEFVASSEYYAESEEYICGGSDDPDFKNGIDCRS
jgi:hypothetical protein